jgi:hypothetical protein
MAKRQRHKPLALSEVLQMLTGALLRAEALLEEATDPDFALRCIHALVQSAGQYSRLLSEGEMEARLRALEEMMRGRVA